MDLSEADRYWLAGVVSVSGELKVLQRRLRLAFYFRSRRRDVMIKYRALVSGRLIGFSRGDAIKLVGNEVHELFEQIWDGITEERRLEFNAVVSHQLHLRAMVVEERAKKEAYEAGIAARPVPTIAQRRARAEALYDNSDPAIQVISDLSPSDAIMAELAQAVAYREVEAKKAQLAMSGHGQLSPEVVMQRNAPLKKKRKPRKREAD